MKKVEGIIASRRVYICTLICLLRKIPLTYTLQEYSMKTTDLRGYELREEI